MVKVQNVWNVNRIQFVTYKSKPLLVFSAILFCFISFVSTLNIYGQYFFQKRNILEFMVRYGGCLSIGKYIRVAQHFYFGLSLLELYFTHILLSSALIGMYEMAR